MDMLAILVAAGRGERMGAGRPKAFLELHGRTLLEWSASAFQRAPSVTGIIAVVPESAREEARRLLAAFDKTRDVVAGGARRQDSVQAGLAVVPPGFAGIVLVHDAARPLVDVDVIEAVGAAAQTYGAALPVLPVADTIKRVSDGLVQETIDRTQLGAAQTPQGFGCALLREACAEAERDTATLTDECMAVERLGRPVAVVDGSPRNRKITTPDDLLWAEDLLRREERAR